MSVATIDDDFQGRKFLNVAQVARILNISKKTVYSMCSRGYLPCFKIGGRVLIEDIDLEVRIKEIKQKPVLKSVD